MEPENLNLPPADRSGDDSRWQALLPNNQETPLPDAGFTQRVMAALPASPRTQERRQWLAVGIAVAIGSALVLASGGHWSDLTGALDAAASAGTNPQFLMFACLTAGLIWLAETDLLAEI